MKKLLAIATVAAATAASAAVPLKFGCAGYTFKDRTVDDMLAILQRSDIHYLCVKDFHLKYTASDEEIATFKAKCASYGVTPYALGPLYTKDVAKTRAYFEFARRFGVKTIVGVPYDATDAKDTWSKRKGSRTLLLEIDRLVKEFDIRYAIHNHGPNSPEMYPSVEYGWELVKDLDPRIGFCLDVGWEYGCGIDPAKCIREHGERIYDLHFKDFEIGKPNGKSVPLGRGKLDFPSIMKALADVGYTGVCSLEYERDFKDNERAVAESAGYFRGVAHTLVAKARMMPVPAGANTLTADEKAEGFKLLFDGKNLPTDLWVGAKKEWNLEKFPERGWYVRDGALAMRPMNGIANGKWFPLPPEDQKMAGGGDIVTRARFRDFVFKFDFRLTEAANSGVKYFYNEKLHKGTCEEYQVLDPRHPDNDKPNPSGVAGTHRVGALYDLIATPVADRALRPCGQWNSGMIVAKGKHVEHWLNGVKVLEYDRGSEAFRAAVALSKYAKSQDAGAHWGEAETGRILLQDHSDSSVSFCNLKVKVL